MDRQENARELLDGPLDDLGVLVGNLRDLRRANRWLGGLALSRRAIHALAADRTELAILDIGTGGADIPAALLGEAADRGHRWRIVATDSRGEILAAARTANPALDRVDGLELHVADGRGLPYPDRSFDVAHASLVLHHLEPADAVRLLAEMGRVSRRGIVVNDLDRGRLAFIGAWLLAHSVTANRYTRHDGPLSVRRSYTLPEARALAVEAGLRVTWTGRGPFRHRWAMAAVPTPDHEIEGVGEDGR